MKYIPPLNGDTEDPDRPYVDAVPGVSEGSRPPAAALEHPLRELVNLIAAAGIVPDEGDLTQVLQAIHALFLAKTGGTLTGDLTLPNLALKASEGTNGNIYMTDENHVNRAIAFWNRAADRLDIGKYNAAGDALTVLLKLFNTGAIEVAADPSTALGIATKQYVDGVASTPFATDLEAAALALDTVAVTPGNLGTIFAQSIGASGYIKLPGGLILQWGTKTGISGEGEKAVTLPITFPTAAIWGNASAQNSTGALTGGSTVELKSVTTNTLTAFHQALGGGETANGFNWMAIGN